MFHTTLRLIPCTTLKYTSTSLDHCTRHPENPLGNALHQSQQPYHNHIHTLFRLIPSSVHPHIQLPTHIPALVALIHLSTGWCTILCAHHSYSINNHRLFIYVVTHQPILSIHQSGNHPIHHLLWHPGIGPWGGFVHCWSGHAGLCLL